MYSTYFYNIYCYYILVLSLLGGRENKDNPITYFILKIVSKFVLIIYFTKFTSKFRKRLASELKKLTLMIQRASVASLLHGRITTVLPSSTRYSSGRPPVLTTIPTALPAARKVRD